MKKTLLAIALAATLARSAAAFEFTHPGFGLSRDDLDYLKANAKEEPYASTLAELKAATPLGYRMRGPFEEVSRTPNRCLGEWCGDMQMIHNAALRLLPRDRNRHCCRASQAEGNDDS